MLHILGRRVDMTNCTDETYLYFYNQEHITPKEMASLILGNDPRKKTLSDRQLKSEVEKIIYHGKKLNNGTCDRHTPLASKELFDWCIKKFPEFNPNMPRHYVLEIDDISHVKTAQNVIVISDDYSDLKASFIALAREKEAEEAENKSLKQEIERLSIFEEQITSRKKSSSKGGSNSRGVKKTGV